MNVSVHTTPVVVRRELKFNRPAAEVAAFLTGPAQLGSWLSPLKSVDARIGGQIEFRAEPGFEHGGHYLAIELPERIVLATEKFGEITATFGEVEGITKVALLFSKEVDDQADYEYFISETIKRFIAMVNYK